LSLERVVNAIMGLGLSETDALVYVFLAVNGPHKAKEISKKTKFYKEQLYRSLKNLKNKHVVKVSIEYPTVYYAVTFEEVLGLLAQIRNEQAQALRETKDELLSSWKKIVQKNSKNS
jgi:sugar-specific transcriptional regulator TrmB